MSRRRARWPVKYRWAFLQRAFQEPAAMFGGKSALTIGEPAKDTIAESAIECASSCVGGVQPGAVAALPAAKGFSGVHESSAKTAAAEAVSNPQGLDMQPAIGGRTGQARHQPLVSVSDDECPSKVGALTIDPRERGQQFPFDVPGNLRIVGGLDGAYASHVR